MRVAFGEDISRFDSGKHKFLHRLYKEFKRQKVKIVDKKADIFLHTGRNLEKASGSPRAKKIC